MWNHRGRSSHRFVVLILLLLTVMPLSALALQPGGPTRATSADLALKRYVAAGDRAYVIGAQDGSFPPMGWHIRGEMGGVWAHPLKLLDGYWFSLNQQWLPEATTFTSGAGYVQLSYPAVGGFAVTRTEFSPDASPVVLVGLTVRNENAGNQPLRLRMTARSELMAAYPWGWSQPLDAGEFNHRDRGRYDPTTGRLVFREPEKPWYAVVGGAAAPTYGRAGDTIWGPIPPAERAGYSEYGNGTGGAIDWVTRLGAGEERTFWFGVAGSQRSLDEANDALGDALAGADGLLAAKVAQRLELLARTRVTLPDETLQAAFDWGKLNMADLRRTVTDVVVRDVDEGRAYPEPLGWLPEITGIGAGFPDYPWYFGTDGAYTAYPLVVSGQWDTAMAHLRGIRDVSRIVNGDTGKVVHEVVTDGSVYFGANDDPGNTNETVQFATAVDLVWQWSGDDAFRDEMYDFIVDGMTYVMTTLDEDGDGWPEGHGMVERAGMGSEKLDVTVYTWAALNALERMAASRGDATTASWARGQADALAAGFDAAWWMASESLYADSLCNEDDAVSPAEQAANGWTNVCTSGTEQLQQRHWINAVPMEMGLAPAERANAALDVLESATFTGTTGLYHTGVGGGPSGAGELRVWTLPSSVMAVGEAAYGRLGEDQALFYMHTIADQLDLEMPGALPEIAPSPEYDPFVDFRERAMFMQAWSSYGIQWPVIHFLLGIRPNAPNDELSVVPDIPETWPGLSVEGLRVGDGEVSASASQADGTYTTAVCAPEGWLLTIGHTLPAGVDATAVTLDGAATTWSAKTTLRGNEVTVGTTGGCHTLVVTTD